MGTDADARYLLSGWSYREGDFRWTDGPDAAIRFAGEDPGLDEIEMELRPHLPPGKIGGQHIHALLNGHEVWAAEVKNPEFASYMIPLPRGYRATQNTLKFLLPEAVAPASVQQPGDHRRLAIAVRYIGRARYPAIPDRGIPMGTNAAASYLVSGWSYPEDDFRWTDGRSSVIRFAGGGLDQDAIEIDLRPYLVPGKILNQHMKVLLNNQEVWTMELSAPGFAPYVIALPQRHIERQNILELIFPDVAVRAEVEASSATTDTRWLGAAVRSIRWARSRSIPDEGIRMGTSDAASYLGAGWSYPEGDFRWTDGRWAAIRFAAGNPIPDAIQIDLRPFFVKGKIESQHVGVLLNGQQVWGIDVTSPEFTSYVIPVPADRIRSQNVLTLILPGAAVPATVAQWKDERRLGVAVRTIRRARNHSSPAIPDDGIGLGTSQAAKYLGLGWSPPEGDFRWTDGRSAVVRFSIQGPAPEAIELDLRPYLVKGKVVGQRVGASLNGQEVWTTELTSPEFASHVIPLPAGRLRAENTLTLMLPDAASPKLVEHSNDDRQLGVAVRHIRRAKIGR